MGDVLGSIWWLLVSLGVLVTFHEFGHYWVARRCGVDVLRFSVGFGKPLWSRFDRHGTEFAIAAIPLGGYVKFLDEREGEVAAAVGVPPWKVKDLVRHARDWTPRGLAAALQLVARADAAVKGAASDPGFALEQLVIGVTAERGRRPDAGMGR